jgi:hypothetical protein
MDGEGFQPQQYLLFQSSLSHRKNLIRILVKSHGRPINKIRKSKMAFIVLIYLLFRNADRLKISWFRSIARSICLPLSKVFFFSLV